MNEEFLNRILRLVDWLNDYLSDYQSELDSAGVEMNNETIYEYVWEQLEYKELEYINEILRDTNVGFLEWEFVDDYPQIKIKEVYLAVGNEFFVSILLLDGDWATCTGEIES